MWHESPNSGTDTDAGWAARHGLAWAEALWLGLTDWAEDLAADLAAGTAG